MQLIRYETAAEQFSQAQVMFVGRAVSSEQISSRTALTRFEVERTLKGPEASVVEVSHTVGDGGASCGVEFRTGQVFAVLAYEQDGRLETSLCAMPQFPIEDYEALSGEQG